MKPFKTIDINIVVVCQQSFQFQFHLLSNFLLKRFDKFLYNVTRGK